MRYNGNSIKAVSSMLAQGVLAAAALVQALALLLAGSLTEYGTFAALQLVQGLMLGVVSALLLSPLLIQLTSQNAALLSTYARLQLALSGIFALLQALLCVWLMGDGPALLAGGAIFFHSVRWYARGLAQLHGQLLHAVASDACSAVVLLTGVAVLWWFDAVQLSTLLAVNLAAALLGCVATGSYFWRTLWPLQEKPDWSLLFQGWRGQGRPALSGTVASEAAANAHSYFAAFLFGPAAFAPLAAAALLFRPVVVVQQSLQQTERPAIRRALLAQNDGLFQQLQRRFFVFALAALGANVLLAAWLMGLQPEWLWSDSSSIGQWQLAGALMAVLCFFRVFRSGFTAQLQARDAFAFLARTAWQAAVWVIPLSVLVMVVFGVVWSLMVVVLAECWLLLRMQQRCASLQRQVVHG